MSIIISVLSVRGGTHALMHTVCTC